MAGPFRFQIPPGLRREDPFVDRDGKNPFADRAASDQAAHADGPPAQAPPSDDNLFAAPAAPPSGQRQPAYRPYGYETTLGHRSGMIVMLGIVSLAMSLLGGLGGLAGWLGGFAGETTLMLFGLAPLSFLSLGASLPTCIMGSHDLRAIRAGAMDAAGLRGTRLGFWLGLVALLTSAALVAIVVISIGWAIANL